MQASAEPALKDYITAVSVLVSVAGLIYTWTKDRLFRRQEYADRIRTAAATTMAKLERWQEIAIQYFEDLEPATVNAALDVADGTDPLRVGKQLWRDSVSARATWAERVMKEEIELAYVHLYAHDLDVQERFADVIRRLDEIGKRIYRRCLVQTQDRVLAYRSVTDDALRGRLGPELRGILLRSAADLQAESDAILAGFRKEVERIVQMDDRLLLSRGFREPERGRWFRALRRFAPDRGRAAPIASPNPQP
jgi:hypothetical protein